MTTALPHSTERATSRAHRSGLTILIVVTGLIVLGAIVFGTWLSVGAGVDKHNNFGVAVSYAPPMIGEDVAIPTVENPGNAEFYYSDIIVSAPVEQLRLPQALLAAASAFPFLIVIVGGFGIITLARRILSQRPFSGAARGLLWAVGTISIVTSILTPFLTVRSTELVVQFLNLPTDGTQVASDQMGWVVPPGFDFLQDTQWPSLVLGIILFFVAILWKRAARMQRDTEGLV